MSHVIYYISTHTYIYTYWIRYQKRMLLHFMDIGKKRSKKKNILPFWFSIYWEFKVIQFEQILIYTWTLERYISKIYGDVCVCVYTTKSVFILESETIKKMLHFVIFAEYFFHVSMLSKSDFFFTSSVVVIAYQIWMRCESYIFTPFRYIHFKI